MHNRIALGVSEKLGQNQSRRMCVRADAAARNDGFAVADLGIRMAALGQLC